MTASTHSQRQLADAHATIADAGLALIREVTMYDGRESPPPRVELTLLDDEDLESLSLLSMVCDENGLKVFLPPEEQPEDDSCLVWLVYD